jgi:hypothetical protein
MPAWRPARESSPPRTPQPRSSSVGRKANSWWAAPLEEPPLRFFSLSCVSVPRPQRPARAGFRLATRRHSTRSHSSPGGSMSRQRAHGCASAAPSNPEVQGPRAERTPPPARRHRRGRPWPWYASRRLSPGNLRERRALPAPMGSSRQQKQLPMGSSPRRSSPRRSSPKGPSRTTSSPMGSSPEGAPHVALGATAPRPRESRRLRRYETPKNQHGSLWTRAQRTAPRTLNQGAGWPPRWHPTSRGPTRRTDPGGDRVGVGAGSPSRLTLAQRPAVGHGSGTSAPPLLERGRPLEVRPSARPFSRGASIDTPEARR